MFTFVSLFSENVNDAPTTSGELNELNKELEKTVQLKKRGRILKRMLMKMMMMLILMIKAKAARGKHKKLDLAVKALKNITTEMKSLARKYSKADESEKEKIKDILRVKTPPKKVIRITSCKIRKRCCLKKD